MARGTTTYVDIRKQLLATFAGGGPPDTRSADLPKRDTLWQKTLHEPGQSSGEIKFEDRLDNFMMRLHGCTAEEYADRLPRTDDEGRHRERRGLPWAREKDESRLEFSGDLFREDTHAEQRIRIRMLMDRGILLHTATMLVECKARQSIDTTAALTVARKWWTSNKSTKGYRHLMISGHRGAGKTFAAGWICNQIDPFVVGQSDSDARTVRFMSAPDFADLTYDTLTQERRVKFEALIEFDVLVIDDMAVESVNDRVLSKLYKLVNERHEAGRRTVYTTQLAREDFESRYGDAVTDRIYSSGLSKHCTGVSMR